MVTIRELTEDDRGAFQEIFTQTIHEEFPEYTQKTQDFLLATKYFTWLWSTPIKFAAFEDQKMLGYIVGEKHFGGVAPIWWLAVTIPNQKHGVGSKLLEHFEKWALGEGLHNLFLYSPERNLNFYKTRGFELVGLHKRGYFDVNDYILAKIIAEPKEENYLK